MKNFVLMFAIIFAIGCGDPKNPGFYAGANELQGDAGGCEETSRVLKYSGIAVGENDILGAVMNFARAPVKEIDIDYLATHVDVVTAERKVYRLLIYDKRQRVRDWWALAGRGFPHEGERTVSGELVISFKEKGPDRGYYYVSELSTHGHIVRNVFRQN